MVFEFCIYCFIPQAVNSLNIQNNDDIRMYLERCGVLTASILVSEALLCKTQLAFHKYFIVELRTEWSYIEPHVEKFLSLCTIIANHQQFYNGWENGQPCSPLVLINCHITYRFNLK